LRIGPPSLNLDFLVLKWRLLPGMVGHACSPVAWRLRQEDLEFEVSLGYTLSQFLKRRKEKQQSGHSFHRSRNGTVDAHSRPPC
jgi:hypothetical protein